MTAPTIVRYEPRGAAVDLLTARDAEVLISGPAGTGKSLAALYKLHLTALQVPGLRALIVRQTHASLTGSTLVTFERKVAVEALAAGVVRWYGGSARQPAAYRYANGSEIVVGGLDRPEKFLSTEFDRIVIDEATEVSETAYETLLTRLRGTAPTYRQIVACCNPAHPTHWIKQRADAGRTRMLTSRHVDNPALVNADGSRTERGAEYLAKLEALTGVRRLRYYDGVWASAEGVIYEQFNEAVHVVDPFEIPASWPRYWSVDFGYTNPFVLQWWAEDPDGRLFLYRELYRTKRLVEEHAAQILSVVRPDGVNWVEPKPKAVVCDHDAEGRATLERHLGLSTKAAHKAVTEGIQAFDARLKPAGDGRPRLFVVRDALIYRDPELDAASKPCGLREEIPGYIWDTSNGRKTKETPVKEDDHACDAGRYLVAYRDFTRRPRIRVYG